MQDNLLAVAVIDPRTHRIWAGNFASVDPLSFEDYLEELQEVIDTAIDAGQSPVLVLVRADTYLKWCADEQLDPDSSASRDHYAADWVRKQLQGGADLHRHLAWYGTVTDWLLRESLAYRTMSGSMLREDAERIDDVSVVAGLLLDEVRSYGIVTAAVEIVLMVRIELEEITVWDGDSLLTAAESDGGSCTVVANIDCEDGDWPPFESSVMQVLAASLLAALVHGGLFFARFAAVPPLPDDAPQFDGRIPDRYWRLRDGRSASIDPSPHETRSRPVQGRRRR